MQSAEVVAEAMQMLEKKGEGEGALPRQDAPSAFGEEPAPF
ncbi:hypothetical protein NO2_1489 [Candidatus Termititenax persephonae]|uniref:Uncharacterized protein n=1 Tax=Candidatus Termititenax persephonae TaxID=2218525 RepID=A0A388TII5_9BACT|nr:hypothetical protein NO2_1489 [Candidatus Termititenax persephonae]